jgi:cysteine desulfurase
MNPIFMDYQSTTPVDRRVLDAMLPYFVEEFGNPHSVEHNFGLNAQRAIDNALTQLSAQIGASADDLVLTSGATESNNMALRGLIGRTKKPHLISCVTEHKSVLGTLSALQKDGIDVTLLPVDEHGRVDPDEVEKALRPTTVLVSIMWVNSEIGLIQPIQMLGHLCRSHGVAFHTDAAQAYGKVDIDVVRDHVDLLSFSAHKIYGPKGIGGLFVSPSVRKRLRPLITGGDQQGGLRAGTVPTALAVGFGTAAALMQSDKSADSRHITLLRNKFWSALKTTVDGVHLNGSADHRIEGNLNFRIDDVDADSLLLALPGLAISTGSACSSGALEPSTVLTALGLTREQAAQSVRIGLGRMSTESDVEQAVAEIGRIVERLRA